MVAFWFGIIVGWFGIIAVQDPIVRAVCNAVLWMVARPEGEGSLG